jgi:hypothetical protein
MLEEHSGLAGKIYHSQVKPAILKEVSVLHVSAGERKRTVSVISRSHDTELVRKYIRGGGYYEVCVM